MSEPTALISSPLVRPSRIRRLLLAHAARRRRWLPSIGFVVVMIVFVPALVVAAALVTIATITSRQIANDLGEELAGSATVRVTIDVETYLGSAMRLSDLYERRLRDGALLSTDLAAWEQTMFRDLSANPDVASICFATLEGDCTWLLHAHGRLELGLVKGTARDKAIEYAGQLDGTVDRSEPLRVYHYDATERPWFKLATESDGPRWTPIYFWFGEQGTEGEVGTGYTRVVRSNDGRVLGVLIIDVTLKALSDFLQRLPITRFGSAYIVDDQGLLVAASEGPVTSREGARLAPEMSSVPSARAIADLVTTTVHGPHVEAPPVIVRRVMVDNEPARAQVTEIKPFPGVHWHVVTVLPEASFLGRARELQERAIVLAAFAVIGGLGVGLLLARRLTQPLMTLSRHVAAIGEGDFDRRLELNDAAELRNLSDELNEMSRGLKERMRLQHSVAVATEVQQSLLPAGMPHVPGLDVFGCSRYCEATGGDYFDFLQLTEVPGKLLVAVGDVTSHGLGSAMLMATARGALRASALGGSSPASIMNRLNLVMTTEQRHGLFMTMAVLLVDPRSGTVHWSSAGHDPAIVFHPDTDKFEQLAGGELPLGIEMEVVYRDYSRECLRPGTILLVGTDGIWEARAPDGEMYGKERLRQLIRAHGRDSAEQITNAIRAALESFTGGAALRDDVTFVVVRVTG